MTEFYDLPSHLKLSNYEISKTGIVRNKTTKRAFTCKPKASGMVGPRFVLDDGTKKNYYVHRLAATTFIPNPDNKRYVHHINGKLADNRVENLRWVSTCNTTKSVKKYNGRPVYQMKDDKIIKKWNQVREAANKFKVDPSYISRACRCNGTFKEYQWKYVDEHDLIPGEKWKTIKVDGCNVNVSNMGRIKYKTGQIVTGSDTLDGYKSIAIYKNKQKKHKRVHRLVATAFVPNPDSKSQINHIDGNKSNNRADNLEWMTNAENTKHAIDSGLRVYNMTESLGTKIIQKDLYGNFIAEYDSIADAVKATGLSGGNICTVCKGKRNKTGGIFRWHIH